VNVIGWRGVLVIVVAGGVALYVIERKAATAVDKLSGQLDVTSRGNVIYRGFSSLLDGIANDGRSLDWWDRAKGWFN